MVYSIQMCVRMCMHEYECGYSWRAKADLRLSGLSGCRRTYI